MQSPEVHSGEADAFRERLLAAMLAPDVHAAEATARDAMAAGLDGLAVLDAMVAPALYEVGRLWETNRISVAEEHLATAVAQRVLVAVYPALVCATPRSRERVLLATTEGERHVVGLRMVSDVLEGAGYDVQYVGADVPTGSLTGAIARLRPQVVGLSNTLALDAGGLAEAVGEIRAVDPGLPVLLGGAGCSHVSEEAGVAMVAGLRSLLPAVERLLAEA